MRYGEYKQYLLVKKSFTVRFQRQIYLFTIKTTNKHFIFSLNIAKIAHLSFSLPDKIISPRRSAPEKSTTFREKSSTFCQFLPTFRQTSPLSFRTRKSPARRAPSRTRQRPSSPHLGIPPARNPEKGEKMPLMHAKKGSAYTLKWVLPCLAKAFNFASLKTYMA